MFPPPPSGQLNDPFGVPLGTAPPMDNAAAVAVWRERQQRQRSLRMLMMFVMMLLLMEGEEPNLSEQQRLKKMKDSLKLQLLDNIYLDENVFKARKAMDKKISKTLKKHPRHQALVELNSDLEVLAQKNVSKDGIQNDKDEIMIHHYPRNATGFYKGSWERQLYENPFHKEISSKIQSLKEANSNSSSKELWHLHTELFQNHGEKISLYALEEGFVFDTVENGQQNETTLSKIIAEEVQKHLDDDTDIAAKIVANYKKSADIPTLPSEGGKAALQLYSTPIFGMNEISYIDGFVKLFDGTSLSSRNDVLLRVRGIALHSIGRLSLLTNTKAERSAMYIQQEDVSIKEKEKNHRRLTQLLQQVNNLSSIKSLPGNYKALQNELIEQIRDEVLHTNSVQLKTATFSKIFESEGFNLRENELMTNDHSHNRRLDWYDTERITSQTSFGRKENHINESNLFPFPYVPDDENHNERKKIAISRSIPSKEEFYEAKTKECEFMINLYATSTQWEITKLEKLLLERKEQMNLISTEKYKMEAALRNNTLFIDTIGNLIQKKNSVKAKEALITELNGDIVSSKCKFAANITVTALRIDWETTKGKAINYSFYMMLTCLAQIVLLLRQLLHTQAQSTASRVSILCIGWQTLLDALFCIVHILLCLIMSPFLPAFSSIAFFKLLIFGVVEMKYMAIIVRARCNSEDPNATAESIRRQVNLIQAKFYASLFFALILFWYIGRKYMTLYTLLLYSFWVPQIIQNIITEAKRPLHKTYIYGMSITRLILPIYIFAFPNNFWKTANPDFESNLLLCQLLYLWVMLQTVILVGQSKYGARFMIPVR